MVKEFGNQFEQFTLEYFKRVIGCPIVIRDYSFRKEVRINKKDETKKMKSPTDLDVVAISKNKIYAITCQEYIPFYGGKNGEEYIKRLVDNLNQGIEDIKDKIKNDNQKIIPVIAFLGIREEDVKRLDDKIGEIIGKKVFLISFIDMLIDFIEEWKKYVKNYRELKESWASIGDFDWLISRIVAHFKVKSDELRSLIINSPRRRRKYKILSKHDIRNLDLNFLAPFDEKKEQKD
jgi:hypothetical protein